MVIGSSLLTLSEHDKEFNDLLISIGDGPLSAGVAFNTDTLWHTWGYNGSTATLKNP